MVDSTLKAAIFVMAKEPVAGSAKTRLSPPLSLQQARDLYSCFLQDVLSLVRNLSEVEPFLAYTPESAESFFKEFAPDFKLLPQRGDSLGERLANAFNSLFDLEYDRVIALSSDSPTLPLEYLQQAVSLLGDERNDMVIGPCEDGGYYLIGLCSPQPMLFLDVTMSTPHVTRDTLSIADRLGLWVARLPTFYDVDDIASLAHLCEHIDTLSPQHAVHTRKCLWSMGREILNKMHPS